MQNKTGILFFARTPEEEALAKRWTSSQGKNLLLAKSLHQKVTAVLAQSKLPVFRTDDRPQKGKRFHDRITNALIDFFAAGYDKAIVVGSDCADLSFEDIQKAENNLAKGKNTYGTSYDGGVYLFTLAKSDFNKNTFLDLPWCTNGLSLALVESIYQQSTKPTITLQRKADFDNNLSQLRPFLRFIDLTFRQILSEILNFCNIFVTNTSTFLLLSLSNPENKGPPALT